MDVVDYRSLAAIVAVAIVGAWTRYEDRAFERRQAIRRGELVDDTPGPIGWVEPTGSRAVPAWRMWLYGALAFAAYTLWWAITH